MIYRKLIVVLVFLVVIYAGFQFFTQMPGTGEIQPVLGGYEFPGKLDGFTLNGKEEKIESENSYITVSCPPPARDYVPKISYKIVYENGKKKLNAWVFITEDEKTVTDCFESNFNFFSGYENMTAEWADVAEGRRAFFLEGRASSLYTRHLMMLDENSNYIVFSNDIEASPEDFVGREDMVKMASEFEVKK